MVGGGLARDGRMTMRIVFANVIERILMMPASPTGRIMASTVQAMATFEATAHPWIRQDDIFLKEIEAAKKLTGDSGVLARWTAVIGGLQRAQMLDHATVPRDDVGEHQEGAEGE